MSAPQGSAPEPTYLERVEISNFRAYGDRFVLTLPNGPGITLISGPNGLGKTTLFDSIEWCLTGAVGRFDPYLGGAAARRPKPFTRLGAADGSHRVSLYFTGAEPVDRGFGFEPMPGDVVQLLKRPEWPDVSDLAQYLSLTHFLGQSAAQRFSVKAPKDQWEALKGPAGVDRINYIKDRIGGQATRQAFTRRLRSAEAELERARKASADWVAVLERLERADRLPRSAAALPAASLVALFTRVTQALAAAGFSSGGAYDEALPTPEAAQRTAASALDQARQQLSADTLRIAPLAPLTEEYSALGRQARAVSELAAGEDVRRQQLAAEAAGLVDTVSHARADLKVAQRDAQQAAGAVEALAGLQDAAAAVSTGTTQLAECEARLTEHEVRSAALDAERLALADEVRRVERELVARRALEGRLTTLRAVYSTSIEVEAARRRSTEVLEGNDVVALLKDLDAQGLNLANRRA